jgi:hypothetical protein
MALPLSTLAFFLAFVNSPNALSYLFLQDIKDAFILLAGINREQYP